MRCDRPPSKPFIPVFIPDSCGIKIPYNSVEYSRGPTLDSLVPVLDRNVTLAEVIKRSFLMI